jgi:hypothetical protein
MWVLLGFSCTTSPITVQDEATATPSSAVSIVPSFFEGDTCTPPCWFGLTPGVSTSHAAEELLLNHELVELPYGYPEFMNGEIDSEINSITDGWYEFNIGPFEVPSTIQTFSRIVIRDSLVYRIRIDVREYITMEEVLNVIGAPDQIRLIIDRGPQTFTTGYASFQLQFIYVDQLLRLVFLTDLEPTSLVYCDANTLQHEFWLSGARYFSPESALDEELSHPNDPQASLTFYDNTDIRYLPMERWVAWINGTESVPCEEAWDTLSTERIFPDLSDFEEESE